MLLKYQFRGRRQELIDLVNDQFRPVLKRFCVGRLSFSQQGALFHFRFEAAQPVFSSHGTIGFQERGDELVVRAQVILEGIRAESQKLENQFRAQINGVVADYGLVPTA